MDRPRYRYTTEGSSKWKNGHNAGCVFHAPPEKCICKEFDLVEEGQPASVIKESLLGIVVGVVLGSVVGLLFGYYVIGEIVLRWLLGR